jgi:hypothetical protein
MKIYIPTRGRIATQTTWQSIGDWGRQNACLVCPESEVSSHIHRGRNVLSRGDVTGINNVREFIMDHAIENRIEKIIMLDDDLIFGKRISSHGPSLRKTTEDDMYYLFERMGHLLNEYKHVGVSPRQMNDKHYPSVLKHGMRINAVHGLRPLDISNYEIRYNDVDLMEDYYMTLSLFAKGQPNAVIVDWTWDQRGGSGQKGGCSNYRTPELQEQASHKLAELFPDFVKVVEKETKTGWEGMKKRYDVRVQWKRAFKAGCPERSSN